MLSINFTSKLATVHNSYCFNMLSLIMLNGIFWSTPCELPYLFWNDVKFPLNRHFSWVSVIDPPFFWWKSRPFPLMFQASRRAYDRLGLVPQLLRPRRPGLLVLNLGETIVLTCFLPIKLTGWWFQTWLLWLPFHIWDVILPIDELIFVKMVIAAPTSWWVTWGLWGSMG